MQILFYTLFSFLPLVLWPYTSELFEFNKMVFVYVMTTLVMAAWLSSSLAAKKVIFRRTILDIPLVSFLVFQLLSTLVSIDPRTSFLGYYSRFNGGLFSIISYSLLYWAYVSNMNKRKTLVSLYCLLISTTIVSVYGILQHFGIDKDVWVQDVQNRVFSTLGQPNWLAAWITMVIPITWAIVLRSNIKDQKAKIQSKNIKIYVCCGLSILFFLTLLYTKSRSGLLGFVAADLLFWTLVLLRKFKSHLRVFLLFHFSFFILALAVGTPWSPSGPEALRAGGLFQVSNIQSPVSNIGPALEVGGTESGTIRKIVWKGAIEIWKHYPIFGTGPETFAYSYYMFRPAEHNLVSEWDFLYNKAHNQYLDIMANSGTFGFLSYLALISFSLLQISKKITSSKFKNFKYFLGQLEIGSFSYFSVALFAGYLSLLVSNFFGFSTVATSVLFFIFPGMAIGINSQQTTTNEQSDRASSFQIALMLAVVSCMLFVVSRIAGYWYSDVLYAKGKLLNDQQDFWGGRDVLINAVRLSPNEPLYHSELAQGDSALAIFLTTKDRKNEGEVYINAAISESNTAISLSPVNINLKRSRASMFLALANIDTGYLVFAKDTLQDAVEKAPTEAKLLYNLGLTAARIGGDENRKLAIQTLQRAVEVKPNYRDARLAYALILIDLKRKSEAKEQLVYILENIAPDDPIAKGELEKLR